MIKIKEMEHKANLVNLVYTANKSDNIFRLITEKMGFIFRKICNREKDKYCKMASESITIWHASGGRSVLCVRIILTATTLSHDPDALQNIYSVAIA